MTRLALVALLSLAAAACDAKPVPVIAPAADSPASAATPAPPVEPARSVSTVYGHVVPDAASVALADLLARPTEFDGKVVKVTGTVSDVCAKRGCWMEVAEKSGPGAVIFKVTDGEIVFPMSAKGSSAVAYGKVRVTPLDLEKTRERAARLAKERGEPFDPATITSPGSSVRLDGIGAEIAGVP